MKKNISSIFRFVNAISFVAACSLVASAQAGGGRVQLESLDRLTSKAVETVNVQVDESLLQIGASLLKSEDPEEKDIKELVVGLRGVYVRVLEFKGEGEYTEGDIAPIREQLRSPGWTRIVGFQSRKDGLENAEVYLSRAQDGKVDGLVFLAVEPKEVVVVNLVGTVDLEKLRRLEGNFGIPKVKIKAGEKAPKSAAAPARKKP